MTIRLVLNSRQQPNLRMLIATIQCSNGKRTAQFIFYSLPQKISTSLLNLVLDFLILNNKISFLNRHIVNLSQSQRNNNFNFFVLFCDICRYRNKISDFFEHFLRYGKYRKKGQKGAKIFVALLQNGNFKLS